MNGSTTSDDVNIILITAGSFIITLYLVGMLLNCIGFYLVYKSGHQLQTNQRLYLMNFITAEILMCTSQIWYVIGHILQHRSVQIYAGLVQCSLAISWCICMIFLTVDRFLEVKLNIAYHVYITPAKVVAANSFVWLLALSNITWMVSVEAFTDVNVIGIVLSFIFPAFEGLFLVICSTVYVYIFRRVKKKQKEARELNKVVSSSQKQQLSTLERKTQQRKKRETKARNFVPLYIILTFLVFSSIPELIAAVFLKGLQWTGIRRSYVMFVATALFATGYIVDALIYMTMYRGLRKMLVKKLRNRISTQSKTGEMSLAATMRASVYWS